LLSAVPLILLRITLPQSLSAGRVPISVIIVDTIFALGGTVMLRLSRRVLYERYEKLQINTQSISGHKESRAACRRRASRGSGCEGDSGPERYGFSIKGFVDDAPEKQGMVIQGIKGQGHYERFASTVRDLSMIKSFSQSPRLRIMKFSELSISAKITESS